MKNSIIETVNAKNSTHDCSKVRLGNMSPAFKVESTLEEATDKKNVRLGNMSPAFKIDAPSKETSDTSKVRLGNMSPVFRT